ncbi:Leucine-rich repeat [Macleaya cordata]|uniref:Leucine-rich repeat n=1 Tax=Macleaya cordata TaxID=56857 RepID=A0A200PRX1_MACCD|nr:Leucine-rich repeat [Macleaya cordata]
MQRSSSTRSRSLEEEESDIFSIPSPKNCQKNPNPKCDFSPDRNPKPPLGRPSSWPHHWFKDTKSLQNVVFKMQLESLTNHVGDEKKLTSTPQKKKTLILDGLFNIDLTSLLSDELLLQILSKLPDSHFKPNSLVCKRWLFLLGRLVRSVKLLDWDFLESGRLVSRFPNLTDVDFTKACIVSRNNSGILLTHRLISINLDSDFSGDLFIRDENLLPSKTIDLGLGVLARGCPNLRRLVLISATEIGLLVVAEECPTLQELELHHCTDQSLRGIFACHNLQIVKLIGSVHGFYNSVISDIGLTILAHGCKRLVKLELSGCEGSYDGIRAIGQCCQMLEELTLCDHRMDEGWIAALSFCGNLKTLRLQSCKRIDPSPGPIEHLGSCPTLERLHLQQCQLRDKQSMNALFLVCVSVREIVFQDCWGLDSEMFSFASICRRVKFLSLERCSSLTTEGLESVVLSWVELQSLKVVSCNNIKDTEVTPALSSLFSVLKELTWRPDSRSLLSSGLAGTGVGKKGGRFFRRV